VFGEKVMQNTWNWHRLYSRFGLNIKYGFRINKPLLLSRVAYNLLRLMVKRQPLLRTVDFAPTYACNFNCVHCFAVDFKKIDSRKIMTIEDYQRCAGEAMQLGAVHFAFQGGEPLILKNLEDIIRACQPHKNLIAVTTNALLLNRQRIAQLKKVGVDLFTISLDSGDAEMHDSFRRHKGAYNQAIQAAKDALDLGINVTFNAVVSHQSVHDVNFLNLVQYTRNMGVKLNILFAVPIGAWKDDESIILTPEDKEYLNKLFASFSHLRRDLDANYLAHGCGAMKEVIYVDCYGDIMPCPYIHASMGNILDAPLETIWRRGLKIDHFREYAPICLAAEDYHFIREHLSKACHAGSLPVAGDLMFPEMSRKSKS